MVKVIRDERIRIDRNDYEYYFDYMNNNSKNGNGKITHISIMECLKEDIEDYSITYAEYQECVIILLKRGLV